MVQVETGEVIAPHLAPDESISIFACMGLIEARTLTGDPVAQYNDGLCQGGVRWVIPDDIETL